MVIHPTTNFTQQVSFTKKEVFSVIIDSRISFHLKQTLSSINAKKCVLITDNNVQEKVFPKIHEGLSCISPLHILSFPAGEQSKTERIKKYLEGSLSKLSVDKNTLIISLGGGVVSDLVGFVAATYHRGLPLIHIPTTLIGMIDAGIGGKVGINTSFAKNIIGCIKHPLLTLINIHFLETLPKQELLNGLAEAIKYAAISSPELFNVIKNNYPQLLSRPLKDMSLIYSLIKRCCQIKLNIVQQDAEDNGIRKILNFGHTTAHALESLSNYRISHGEAVAIGMKVATLLSLEQGYLPPKESRELLALLNILYKNKKINFSLASIQKTMMFDKKRTHKDIQFVLLKNLGNVMSFNGKFTSPVPLTLLKSILKKVLQEE